MKREKILLFYMKRTATCTVRIDGIIVDREFLVLDW